MLGAWVIFLALTATVFALFFRSTFPSSRRQEYAHDFGREGSVTIMIRELDVAIAKGFLYHDPAGGRRTFDILGTVFAQKVKRVLELDEAEFRAMLQSIEELEAKLKDHELVQLIRGNFGQSRTDWDIANLSKLISKVEVWGA